MGALVILFALVRYIQRGCLKKKIPLICGLTEGLHEMINGFPAQDSIFTQEISVGWGVSLDTPTIRVVYCRVLKEFILISLVVYSSKGC